MSLPVIQIRQGDFVYIPHLSEDVHEVKDKRHNFANQAKLCVEINGEDIFFTPEGQTRDKNGDRLPVAIAYPAIQIFKDRLETLWGLKLAPARPRTHTHSMDVREHLKTKSTPPLCWLSCIPITSKEVSDKQLSLDFIYSVNEYGQFVNRHGMTWEYAQLVKPSDIFINADFGDSHE